MEFEGELMKGCNSVSFYLTVMIKLTYNLSLIHIRVMKFNSLDEILLAAATSCDQATRSAASQNLE
jgi:hypothetical protein